MPVNLPQLPRSYDPARATSYPARAEQGLDQEASRDMSGNGALPMGTSRLNNTTATNLGGGYASVGSPAYPSPRTQMAGQFNNQYPNADPTALRQNLAKPFLANEQAYTKSLYDKWMSDQQAKLQPQTPVSAPPASSWGVPNVGQQGMTNTPGAPPIPMRAPTTPAPTPAGPPPPGIPSYGAERTDRFGTSDTALDTIGKQYGIPRGTSSGLGQPTTATPNGVYQEKIRQAEMNDPNSEFNKNVLPGNAGYQKAHGDTQTAQAGIARGQLPGDAIKQRDQDAADAKDPAAKAERDFQSEKAQMNPKDAAAAQLAHDKLAAETESNKGKATQSQANLDRTAKLAQDKFKQEKGEAASKGEMARAKMHQDYAIAQDKRADSGTITAAKAEKNKQDHEDAMVDAHMKEWRAAQLKPLESRDEESKRPPIAERTGAAAMKAEADTYRQFLKAYRGAGDKDKTKTASTGSASVAGAASGAGSTAENTGLRAELNSPPTEDEKIAGGPIDKAGNRTDLKPGQRDAKTGEVGTSAAQDYKFAVGGQHPGLDGEHVFGNVPELKIVKRGMVDGKPVYQLANGRLVDEKGKLVP